MRLAIAIHVAFALGTFLHSSGCSAFVVPSFHEKKNAAFTRIRVGSPGQGWENDGFLDALSGSSSDRDKANQDYNDDSVYRPDQTYKPGQDRGPTREEENFSQGGRRLKELLAATERAKATQAASTSDEPPLLYTPPKYMPPENSSPPPQAAPIDAAAAAPDMAGMTVEQQAAMFRQFMANQQQGGDAVAVTEPSYESSAPASAPKPMGGVDKVGRKIGRNRDADIIANASDLYFAQLKRDSTVRTRARYADDTETANNVFGHESVKEIEEMQVVNPYLEAQKAEDKLLEDARKEEFMEELIPLKKRRVNNDRSYSGVNFKDKMKRAKEKNSEGSSGAVAAPVVESEPVVATPPPVVADVAASVPAVPQAAVEIAPPAVVATSPPVVADVVTDVAASVPAVSQAAVETAPPANQTPDPTKHVPDPSAPPTTDIVAPFGAVAKEDSEESRRNIRTLMGLILKHRGGPGFGSGRLAGPDAQKLESLADDVSAMLRSEANMAATVPADPVVAQVGPIATATAPSGGGRLTGTIACIKGAVHMYESSAAGEQADNLVALRTALLAAVNTCNQVIAEREVAQVEVAETTAAVAPLPAATMGFPDTYEVTKTEESAPPVVGMGFPDTYAVTKVEESAPPPTAPASGTDENSQILNNIYDKLQGLSGDGKYGLKDDLTAAEADALADDLVDMKSVLLDELGTGVPEAPSLAPEPQSKSSADGDDPMLAKSQSPYAKALAKAQSKKETPEPV